MLKKIPINIFVQVKNGFGLKSPTTFVFSIVEVQNAYHILKKKNIFLELDFKSISIEWC